MRFCRWTLVWIWFAAACTLWALYLLVFGNKDFSSHKMTQSICRPVLWILGIKIHIENKELLTKHQPCVYIANHQDTLDIFSFGAIFPPQSFVVAKKSLKYMPFFGWVFSLSNNIYVDRFHKGSAKRKLANAEEAITKQKRSFFVFPEGTRSRGKGLGPFKKGAFHVAMHTQVPIVAMVCKNYDINYNKKNSGTINFKIFPPVYIDSQKDLASQVENIRNTILDFQNS